MPREYEHPSITPQSAQSESTSRPVLVAQHQGVFPIDTGEYEELFARIQRYWEAEESAGPDIPEDLGPSLFDPDDRTQDTISIRLAEAHVDNLFPWGEILPNARKIEVVPPSVNREMRREQERKKHKKPDAVPKKGTHPKTEKGEKSIIRDGQYSFKGDELPNFQEKENGSGQVTRHEKEMKKLANKMAKEMRERAEKVAARQDKADNQATKEPGKGEYRVVAGKVVPVHSEQNVVSRLLAKVNKTASRVVEKLPRDIVPEPLTALQRLTSIATTFIAGSVALVAPFSTRSEGKSAADAAKPSSRPAGIEAQAFNFGKEEAIPSQSEAKKDFVQEKRKLIYPPGINPEIWLPSVQLPESPELYRFMTLQDEGEDGVGKHDTPSEERFGNSDLIGTIYTTAQAYKAKYKNSQLVVADLTAPGHTSHDKNIDVDIYLPDGGLKIGSDKYDKNRAVELGIMLINTGKIELIIFNDDYVIEKVNKYAEDNNLPGRMINEGKHNRHMHVRIKEKEVKINIPWMPEQVTRWNDLIIAKAKKYNVDPEFVSVIMYKESSGNPRAGSGVGAQGLMQIMPETAAGIARELGVKNYDIWDPETNIEFGTYYLSQLLKKYGRAEHSPSWDRSIILASIGYNGGPGAADGYLSGRVTEGQGPFCESREYAYYVVGMWRERHEQASKHFDELNQIGHRCNKDAKSYPVASLK